MQRARRQTRIFQRPVPAPKHEPADPLELADTLDFEAEEPTNELPARTGADRSPAGR